MQKICSKCTIAKELTDENFGKCKGKWISYCKPCGRAMCKSYKTRNKQYISEYNKTYKKDNKNAIDTYNKKYYNEHRETELARTKATHKRLLATNPSFKMAHYMRKRMRTALNGTNKSESTKELLGCDIEFFQKWIEYQFIKEMTMQNYGSVWHLDHVVPCASFDLTNSFNQRKCFHWTNYQPMLGDENIAKGDKIMPELINEHEEKVLKFVDDIGENLGYHYKLVI